METILIKKDPTNQQIDYQKESQRLQSLLEEGWRDICEGNVYTMDEVWESLGLD